jgi:hypothetical protein
MKVCVGVCVCVRARTHAHACVSFVSAEILCCTARMSTCWNTLKVTKICDDTNVNEVKLVAFWFIRLVTFMTLTHKCKIMSEHCGREEKFSPLWKVFSTLYCSKFLQLSQCFPPSQLHYSWWVVLIIKLVSLLNVAGKFSLYDQLHLLLPLFSCFWTHSVITQCCFSLPKSTSCKCVTWKEHDVKTVIRNKELGLWLAVLDF